MRYHRRVRLPVRTAVAAAACFLFVSCHVGDSLSDCERDSDCADDQRCHPEGHFCELDRTHILIGVTLALTGDLGAVGSEMEEALTLAAQQIDDAGGVLGRPVRFEILDDAGDTDVARQNVEDLVRRGAVAIIGPMKSGQASATAPITHAARVVQISPTAGSPCLDWQQPEQDRYFFRTISTMRLGSGAAIALEAGASGCTNLGILHSEDETGYAFAEAIETLFEANGGDAQVVATFPPGVVLDYEPHIAALNAAAPDCVALVAWPDAGAAILRENEAQAGLPTPRWFGTTALRSGRFLELSRRDPLSPTPSFAEGFRGADTDSTPPTRHYQDFRDIYNAAFDREPGTDTPPLVANAFDAAILLALAIEKAGTARDGVRVRDGLWAITGTSASHVVYGPGDLADAFAHVRRGRELHYHGASSALVFDGRGTVTNPTLIWTVSDGALAIERRYSEDQIATLTTAAPPQTSTPAFCMP